MTLDLGARWDKKFQQWMASRIPPRESVTLDRKIIYIIPSSNGLMFVVAAGLVFIAAINYAVSLAFGLAFLMVSIFILAILHCFNNLNQLTFTGLASRAVFAGEQATFRVKITRSPTRKHEALHLNFPGENSSHADLFINDQVEVDVFAAASKRGYFKAPLLKTTTYYPLGLCRAWSVLDLNLRCLVYPKPIPFVMSQFNIGSGGTDDSAIIKEGSEDFYGLRDYVPGDSMRQVAWKNVARGQGMQVKQFVDYVDNKVWLDWDMFYGFNTEERLSRLCYCILKLSKQDKPFGMKIPGSEIPPDTGPEHKKKLLRTLALFGVE